MTVIDTPTPTGRPVRSTADRYGLTHEQLDALGHELDELRQSIVDDLGPADVEYIRRMIRVQRGLELAGRGLLFVGFLPPAWLGGTAALALSKILDNMEIGHNVMHGQYDWTRDPSLSALEFEWDTVCPGDQWRHTHNYLHHTYTNIVGRDRDLGYGVLRMSDEQPWKRVFRGNIVYATLLAIFFEEGVMLHDVEVERIQSGEKTWSEAWPTLREGLRKTGHNFGKDYVLWPLLTGPLFLSTLAANATANVVRNLWAFTIIFCGHFPDGAHQFSVEECEGESKGHWYFRQMLGSANIEGGRLFHILSGNLSHQIEHHLFPDLPARRYQAIAPQVRDICERYGLPYNRGGLVQQFGSVVRRIWRLGRPPSAPADSPPAAEPLADPDALVPAA